MQYGKKVISLALLIVVALSVVTMLAFTPMKASAQSQDTVKITTSRDAWGKVWYNEEFYVDVTIVPPPSTTNVSLIVTVGSVTNVVNATRIAPTSATFRANFSVDTSGNLYWISVKGAKIYLTTLSEGDTITFSYGGINKTLTFEHTPATAVIRSSIPTYGIKFVGTQDWIIKAPDLNKNPYAPDEITATLKLFVFDPYKGTSTTETIMVPFEETGPNTGEFAPVPTYSYTNTSVLSTSSSSVNTTVTINNVKVGPNATVSFSIRFVSTSSGNVTYVKPVVNSLYYLKDIELANETYNNIPNDTFVKMTWSEPINLTMNGKVIQSWWLANVTAYINITTLPSGGYDVQIKNVTLSSDVLSYYYAAFNVEVHSPDTITVTVTVPTYQGSSYTDSYEASVSASQVAPSLSVSASLSGGVTITVNCSSFNYRSYAEDSIWVNVAVGTNTTVQPVELTETDVNTGVFQGTLPASLLLKDLANGYLSGSINNITVTLTYWVELWNSTASKWEFKTLTAVKTATLTYHLASISKTVPSQVTIGKTLLTVYLNDVDLNLNPYAIDQPNTVTLSQGSLAIIPVNHTIYGKSVEFGKLMLFAVTKEGEEILLKVRFPSTMITFIETGADTGVFKVSINLAAFNLSKAPESGDYVTGLKIVYEDYFNPDLQPKNVSVTIPVISPSISVDRSTIPLTLIGNGPIVQVKVVDPEANLNPYVQDSLPLSNFKVYFVYANGVEEDVTSEIIKPSSVLETGPDTSTFIFNITIPKSLITPKLIGGKLLLQYETLTSHTLLQTEVPFEVYGVKILVNGTTSISASYGQCINITVISQDFNLYNSGKDEFTGSELQISGPSIVENSVFKETGPGTGVFEAIIPVNASLGSPGQDITISITDLTSPNTQYGYASWLTSSASISIHIKAHLAKLIVPSEHGPYGVINITLVDPDLMYNSTAPIYIHWWNGTTKQYSISKVAGTAATFTMLLNISKYYSASEVIGKSLVIMYYDTTTPSGTPVLLKKTVKFISWNPVIMTNKEYYSIGQSINITIKDPDANKNPNVRETITVVIKSTAYPMGKTVTLLETGPDTGVFSGVVVITDNLANALKYSNYIYAKYGNEINISYYDEYPANFAQTGTGEWFTHTVYVGVPVTKPIVASKPAFINPFTGQPITKPTVGVPVGISVNITNTGYEEKTFTVLMIVRNPSGVAIQISWVTVTLAAGAKQTVGFSFTPPATGSYTIEIHIIASLAHPAVLGSTVTTTLSVSA